MDKDRIRRAATGHRASDVSTRARRRVGVYAVGIVVILGWYLWEGLDAEPPVTRATEPLGPVDVPAENAERLSRVDPGLLADVEDDTRAERARLEPGARRHLIEKASRLVYGDLLAYGLRRGDHDELLARGDAHRGDAVWAIGELSWLDSQVVGGLPEVIGEIVDQQGRSWAFLVTSEPWDLEPGDVVKIEGFFFKAYDLARPDGTIVTAPLVVGEELIRSAFPIEPVTELRGDVFAHVRDGDLATAQRPLDSPAFYELLSFVHHAPAERVFPSDRPTPEVLPSELLQRPGAWRGHTVSVTGVLYYMRERPLGPRGENPLGVPFVWELWVSDNRAGEMGTMLVLSLEKPPVEQRQIVTVEGAFFRRYAFENKRNRPRMVPVVMARRVETFVPEPDRVTPMIRTAILWIVGVVALLIVVASVRERRREGIERSRRMARKGRLVGRRAGPSGGTAGDGPGPPASGKEGAAPDSAT